MTWIVTYFDSSTRTKGRKRLSGHIQNKVEAGYRFKYLHPDLLILEIINDFNEKSQIKSTVETGKY